MPNDIWTPPSNWNTGTNFTEAKAEQEITDDMYALWLAVTVGGSASVPHGHAQGTNAARPAAAAAGPGVLYRATDDPKLLSFSDGADWLIVGGEQPHAHVHRTTDQSIPDSANTALSFNAEDEDNDAMWSIGVPTQLIAKTAGWFEYGVLLEWDADSVGYRKLFVQKGGVTIAAVKNWPGGVSTMGMFITGEVEMAINDSLIAYVDQTSGNPLLVLTLADSSPRFWMRRKL